MASIHEVAERANVSLKTVSRVLNDSSLVAPATRERVLRASRECGYYPHAGARAMRQGQFKRIAAAVVQYGPPGTAYFPKNAYTDAAADALARHGYSLVFEPLHLEFGTDRFYEPPRLFMEFAVDGVLGLPAGGIVPPEVDEQLQRLGVPVVWMNRHVEPSRTNVACDELASTRTLVGHLLDLGHRRIGYAGFQTPHYAGEQRRSAVVSELNDAGLDASAVILADKADLTQQAVEAVLEHRPAVTAMICFHLGVFTTALHVIASRGLRVPRDLSICYFASPWELALTKYPVTLMEVPESRMAVAAVEMLVATLAGQDVAVPEPIAGTLHVGRTTRTANDK